MLHKPIPLCVALPDAGHITPPELQEYGAAACWDELVQPEDRALAQALDLSHRMDSIILADVPKSIVNLNVPLDDALPDYLPSGMPIYPADRKLYHRIRRKLIERYYKDYYAKLDACSKRKDIHAGLAVHFYQAESYPMEDRALGKAVVCLSNNGDALGGTRFSEGSLTCEQEMIRDIRDIFSAQFSGTKGSVLLNTPIQGSHLIRTQAAKGIPWIRVDLDRSLIMSAEDHISPQKVELLQNRLENLLVLICKLYEWM